MHRADPQHATLDEWIAREAIQFSVDSTETFGAAVAQVVASLGGSVELLGFGEPLHGGEEILAVGTAGEWGGAPDATTVFPQAHDIDYIRRAQRLGGGGALAGARARDHRSRQARDRDLHRGQQPLR